MKFNNSKKVKIDCGQITKVTVEFSTVEVVGNIWFIGKYIEIYNKRGFHSTLILVRYSK